MKYYDTSFDNQFNAIENLTWKPWVGKDYSNSEHKVLIIGESHYEWATESDGVPASHYLANDNFSRELIKDRCLGSLKAKDMNEPKFYTNAVLSIGNGISDELRQKVWSNAAFYNFIQRPMKENGVRPNKNDFTKGWNVFDEVISALQPTYCIIFGLEIGNNFTSSLLPNWKTVKFRGKGKSAYKVGDVYGRYIELEQEKHTMKGVFVRHPSSHFSWSKWHQFMKTHIPNYINSL
jgi:hypothetical protein